MRNDTRDNIPRLYPNGDVFTRTEPNRMKAPGLPARHADAVRTRDVSVPNTGESGRSFITSTRVDMFNAITDYVAFMLPKVDRLEDQSEASAVYEFAASVERKFAELATAAGERLNELQGRTS